MATDDKSSDQKPGKGFAGLSSMVSDVDAALASARASGTPASLATPAATPSVARRQSQESEPYQAATSAPSSPGESSGWKWVLGVAGVLGAMWFFSETTNKPPSRSTTSYVEPPPAPAVAPTPPRGFQPLPSTPSRLAEDMPPVGTGNVLSVPQIRYCLAEDIRIEGAKGVLNKYDNDAIDRFNATVEDYNSRCGSFRYRRGALESARSDVESIRSTLQREGEARFTSRPSVSPLTDREVFGPDPTTLAIQQRLNELGFDAGSPDGFIGPRTRNAISAFQKSVGLSADGQPTPILLTRLTETVVTPSSPAMSKALPPPAAAVPAPMQDADATFGKPDLSNVSADERAGIERSCSGSRQYSGPAAYYACLSRELQSLSTHSGKPDLSNVSADERAGIERSCSGSRQYSGPAAYYACLSRELQSLSTHSGKPDLSNVSADERAGIERSCSGSRQYSGPAAYYACLSRELQSLSTHSGKPDLSVVNQSEREAIERSCSGSRQYSGPAAYYACLSRELAQLRRR